MAQVGLVVGIAAANAALQSRAAREQQRISDRASSLNLAQQQAAIADRRAVAARDLRQRMAAQMSLAGRRGGSSSLIGQFAAQSQQNFADDMMQLGNQARAAELQHKSNLATSAANTMATRIGGFGSILSSGADAYAMSAFGNTGANNPTTKAK